MARGLFSLRQSTCVASVIFACYAGSSHAAGPGPLLAAFPPADYLHYDETVSWLATVAEAHPDLCRLVDVTARLGLPATAEGRHLWAVRVTSGIDLDLDKPTALLVSGQHAREVGGPLVVLDALDRLVQGYGRDPAVTAALDAQELWLAPIWNPDGYEYALVTDGDWRKNRRALLEAAATGEPVPFGVDLNRNYPFGWDADCSGSVRFDDENYRGPAAGSEVETRTMMQLADEQHFSKVLDVHSPGREVVFGTSCVRSPLEDLLVRKAGELSRAAGYDGARRTASGSGEHPQFELTRFGSLAFILEIGSENRPSFVSALTESAQVWPAVGWWLAEPIALTGHVRDACTGQPLAADISLTDGSRTVATTHAGGRFGRFSATVPTGAYAVTFAASGYQLTQRVVTVDEGSTATLDVPLVPESGCGQGAVTSGEDAGTAPERPDAHEPTVQAPGVEPPVAPPSGGCDLGPSASLQHVSLTQLLGAAVALVSLLKRTVRRSRRGRPC